MIRRAISPRLASRTLRIDDPIRSALRQEGGDAFTTFGIAAAAGDPTRGFGAQRVGDGLAGEVASQGLGVGDGAGCGGENMSQPRIDPRLGAAIVVRKL